MPKQTIKVETFFQWWFAFKQHNKKAALTKKLMQTSWFQTSFAVLVYCHFPLTTFHRHGLGNLPMVYCAKVLLQTLVVLNTEIMVNRRSLANRPKCLFQPISTACLRERAVTKHPSSLSSMPLEIYSNSEINPFLLTTITGYIIQWWATLKSRWDGLSQYMCKKLFYFMKMIQCFNFLKQGTKLKSWVSRCIQNSFWLREPYLVVQGWLWGNKSQSKKLINLHLLQSKTANNSVMHIGKTMK